MYARGGLQDWFLAAKAFTFALALPVATCGAADKTDRAQMQLTSTAFSEGEPIPAKHTCEGKNVSPPLKWSGAPASARGTSWTRPTNPYAADDPDAPVGTWVHWVLYDLPASATELAEDLPKGQFLPNGAKQGINDFRHLGYGGPCPPPGKAHRYFFKLYALDAALGLKPGASKKEIEQAMDKHVLAQTQLMVPYKRK